LHIFEKAPDVWTVFETPANYGLAEAKVGDWFTKRQNSAGCHRVSPLDGIGLDHLIDDPNARAYN
jgi:hypothetical protein